jgi:hypothetical protein
MRSTVTRRSYTSVWLTPPVDHIPCEAGPPRRLYEPEYTGTSIVEVPIVIESKESSCQTCC